MTLYRLRVWQWVAIGSIVGVLAGAIRSAWGPSYLYSNARTLSYDLFERGITAPPGAAFHVSDLLVHPPSQDGSMWVTGTYHERGRKGVRERPFKFRASTPYPGRLAVTPAGSGRLSVLDYLAAVAPRVPQAGLAYHYAWYERPAAGTGASGAIGVAAGLLLSAVVRILVGPRIREMVVAAALQTAPRPPPPPAAQNLPDQAMTPRDEPLVSLPPAEPAAGRTAILALRHEPVVGQSAPAENREYGGEFYPTEVHAQGPS